MFELTGIQKLSLTEEIAWLSENIASDMLEERDPRYFMGLSRYVTHLCAMAKEMEEHSGADYLGVAAGLSTVKLIFDIASNTVGGGGFSLRSSRDLLDALQLLRERAIVLEKQIPSEVCATAHWYRGQSPV